MTTWLYIKKIEWNIGSKYLEFHLATQIGYDIEYIFKVKKSDCIEDKLRLCSEDTKWENELQKKFNKHILIKTSCNYNTYCYFNALRELWNRNLAYEVIQPVLDIVHLYNDEVEEYMKTNLDKTKIIKLDTEYCPTCGQELPKKEIKKIPYKFSDSEVIEYKRFSGNYWINYQPTQNGNIQIWNKTNLKFEVTNNTIGEYIPCEYKIYIALLLSYFNRLKTIRYNMYSIHLCDIFNNPTFSYINKGTRAHQYFVKDEFNPVENELISSIKKVNKIIKNKEKLPQELENILLCDNFLELVYNNEFDGVDLMADYKEDRKVKLYYE